MVLSKILPPGGPIYGYESSSVLSVLLVDKAWQYGCISLLVPAAILFHHECCPPSCLAGMDLLKHGESAYPADAWVEQQYMQDFSMEVRDDWEMLNFWKSFVNGFTYNQVGQTLFYFSSSQVAILLFLNVAQKSKQMFQCAFFLCALFYYTNIASSSQY